MKRMTYLAVAIFAIGLVACNSKQEKCQETTENFAVGDSVRMSEATADADKPVEMFGYAKSQWTAKTDFGEVGIEAEYPKGNGEIVTKIRHRLADFIDNAFAYSPLFDNDQRQIRKFGGGLDNLDDAAKYYSQALSKDLTNYSREEYNNALKEDPEMELYNFMFYYIQNIAKDYEDGRVVAFNITTQVQPCGAVHGTVQGPGFVVFDKSNGAVFNNFIKKGSDGKMQKILRRGLIEYLEGYAGGGAEDVNEQNLPEYLLLVGDQIPLPSMSPCPAEGGLKFCYYQYEVTPYCYNMPTFIVPYAELMPYLTDEAKELLAL